MTNKKRIYHHWKQSEVRSFARRFKSRTEFARKNFRAYQWARRKGVLNHVCKHMKDMRKLWGKARHAASIAFHEYQRGIEEIGFSTALLKPVWKAYVVKATEYAQKNQDKYIETIMEKKGISRKEAMKYFKKNLKDIIARRASKAFMNYFKSIKHPYRLPKALREKMESAGTFQDTDFDISPVDVVERLINASIDAMHSFREYRKYFGNRAFFGTTDAVYRRPKDPQKGSLLNFTALRVPMDYVMSEAEKYMLREVKGA